jgi:hypothetical protein
MNRLSQRALAPVAAVGLLLAPLVASAQTPAAPKKLISPVRGEATVEITKPDTKVGSNEVVTTFLLKNTSSAPIAGLRVEENWYDRAGQPIGGDVFRSRSPIMPGQVIKIELTSPRRTGMGGNQYNFSHANGTIGKPKVVPKLAVTPTT